MRQYESPVSRAARAILALMFAPSMGGEISFKLSVISQASAVTRVSHNLWDICLFRCCRVMLDTEGAMADDLDRKGVLRRDYSDRAWISLDHECAVRESGKSYRPARLYDRPQLAESAGGNPRAGQKESK